VKESDLSMSVSVRSITRLTGKARVVHETTRPNTGHPMPADHFEQALALHLGGGVNS